MMRKRKIYPDFVASTGYGTGAGLCGWNCRHSFGPYVEGAPRVWTDEKLAELNEPKYEYQGEKLTEYEAQQRENYFTRQIHRWNREAEAMCAAGQDPSEAMAKAREWRARQKDFLENRTDLGVAKTPGRGIIKSDRPLALGLRAPASRILTDKEIESILLDADALNIKRSLLRFNTGGRTGFIDVEQMIDICGDVLPDLTSKIARDRMSQRAVLAHEYYGHFLHHPSEYDIGDWRDEFRASYEAAKNAPNLSPEDRGLLMIDAYDRAREAGVNMEYDNLAKEIIYGIH